MSALAMILTAAMMVPGHGPENVSGEMVRESEPLDLKAKWKGIWYRPNGSKWDVEIVDHFLSAEIDDGCTLGFCAWRLERTTDEGGGKLVLREGEKVDLGIYEQHNDRLVICYSVSGRTRPTSFRSCKGQHLLVLHRIKSRK